MSIFNPSTALEIGEVIDGATPGSVLFVGPSGELFEDNPNFFWDDTNDRLGIGTNTPSQKLHILDATSPGNTARIFAQNTTADGGTMLELANDSGSGVSLSVTGSTWVGTPDAAFLTVSSALANGLEFSIQAVTGDYTWYTATTGLVMTLDQAGTLDIANNLIVQGTDTSIRGVNYTWPATDAPVANDVLSSDGAGNLSWQTVGPGSAGGWTDDGATVRLSTLTDSVAVGVLSAPEKFHVAGDGKFTSNLEIDGALNHDGSTLGFFGATPVAQSAAYTVTNWTGDRTIDLSASFTLDELGQVVGTMIQDLISYGLFQGSVT